jgi:hypothetical protein
VLLGTKPVLAGSAVVEGVVPRAAWPLEIEVRPVFPPAALALYERGRALVSEKKLVDGFRTWNEAIAIARADAADLDTACWLLGRIGQGH